MTCIVGLVKDGNVWLGGDSAATDGHLNRTIIKDPKVFLKGEVGFGVCGSPKVLDVLAHGIELPVQSGGDDRSFLVSVLVPAIREGLQKLDAVTKDENEERHPSEGNRELIYNGEMLIAYRGKLYKMQGNFQLIQSAEGYDTTGSGGTLAKGSLRSTKHITNPKKRILQALEASTANASCAPPFVIIKVKKKSHFWK